MADVPGVEHELGRRRQGIDLVDSRFKGGSHVRIGRLVEPHVAVADLNEAEVSLGLLFSDLGKTAEAIRLHDSAVDHAQGPRAGPSHALQEPSAVDSVIVVLMQNLIFIFIPLTHGLPPSMRTNSARFYSTVRPEISARSMALGNKIGTTQLYPEEK